MKSNPPEYSGGRGRAVVLEVFQRGAVRRIYAAHRFFPNSIFAYSPKGFVAIPDKIHVSFFLLLFFFFSFFLFRRFFGLLSQGFADANQTKVPSTSDKSTVKWDKSTVYIRQKYRFFFRQHLHIV